MIAPWLVHVSDWLKENAWVGDMAGWVTAIAAIVALWFGIVQVRSAKKSQLEATAKEIWMNYELHGLQYAEYANPELSKFDYKKLELDESRQKFFEYQWFVSLMFLACDEVLQLRGRDWEQIVENNIKYHWRYIQSSAFKKDHVLSPRIENKITQLRHRIVHKAAFLGLIDLNKVARFSSNKSMWLGHFEAFCDIINRRSEAREV